MSTPDRASELTPAAEVHDMWLSTLDFLAGNATPAWAHMIDAGSDFVMPPQVRALRRSTDRAAALARAEADRLAAAELFHFDTDACRAAAKAEVRTQSLLELAPSPSGLIVWEEAPFDTGGIPIRAASWGIAYDGGTWMSWWIDTAAAIRLRGLPNQILGINGHLTFHEEAHIPPNGWPGLVDRPEHRFYPAHRSLLGAWAAIDTGAVTQNRTLDPAPAVRKQAKRLRLDARPLRSYGAGTVPALATTPETIVQRTLGRLLLPHHPYPGNLPADLAPWHCYLADSGHCLLVMIDPMDKGSKTAAAHEDTTVADAFVPAPVKAVLRAGWRIEDGHIRTPMRYDIALGLLTDPDDDEFDTGHPAP
ncbi:hypothetical protein [Kitasatospora sp. NPDC002965]|uniref:hypothetical protein n=1 Tax=Kitasatospora sp. NPDC002965 TaxID=3154775 RepID=UPI0033B7C819